MRGWPLPHSWLFSAAVLLACRRQADERDRGGGRSDNDTQATHDTGAAPSTTADTGTEPAAPCPLQPCAADLYAAKFVPDDDPDSPDDSSNSEDPATTAGSTLLVVDGMLLVGAPSQGTPYHWSEVYVVRPTDLGFVASWWRDKNAGFGAFLAARDVDGNGTSEVAIAAPDDFVMDGAPGGRDGGAYLLSGVPGGEVEVRDAALLTLRGAGVGTAEDNVGAGGVAFLDLQGAGTFELLVASQGNVYDGITLFAIDPALRGELAATDASWSISGPCGSVPTGWDGDGDGIDDLVIVGGDAVARFASPLADVTTCTDGTTLWTRSPASESVPLPYGGLGDLTGDGMPDLGLGDEKLAVTATRAGGAYVVEGGDLASRSVDAIAIRGQGAVIGDGFGTSLASGDLDGDGQLDLVVGARGMPQGADLPGRVLAFYGPLSGPMEESEAAFVVHGEYTDDYFGASLATYDADLDGRSELYVGAYGHDRGAAYLFHVVDLAP